MIENQFSAHDIKEFEARGLTVAKVREQLAVFEKGPGFCRLNRPCTSGDGIMILNPSDEERLLNIFEQTVGEGRAQKFVPASGAATRMFKSLLDIRNRLDPSPTTLSSKKTLLNSDEKVLQEFIHNLNKFPFYQEWQAHLKRQGLKIDELGQQGQYRQLLDSLLSAPGLDLSRRPKGLILFHVYPDHVATPLEEHLKEGVAYIRDSQGLVRLHLTVLPGHQNLFKDFLKRILKQYEKGGIKFQVTFSEQSPSTDTLAMDKHNRPLRDRQNQLSWHPGGHGALLANLNELKGDIIFIKNIDNVVPDRLRAETIRYKKILGGLLITLQERIFEFLEKLMNAAAGSGDLAQAFRFIHEWLSIETPAAVGQGSEAVKARFLIQCLHKPLRICGMVKNKGEPGGGPFWVEDADGSVSLQIVESPQVDHAAPEQETLWKSSTHFNPVDLVCGVRDYTGQPFDLRQFVDPQKGFISSKSRNGEEYKVYEWPGLWMGAMAYWNTVFIEVPLITFTPVKTVLDLLRKEHQPE